MDWEQLKLDLFGNELSYEFAGALKPLLPPEWRRYKARRFWGLVLQHYRAR